MSRGILLLFLLPFGLPTMITAAQPADQLPKPEYQRQPSDLAWLANVV